MKPLPKTNVMRLLDGLGIPYGTASYPVGDAHVDAVSAAREMGVAADVVWKTLVAQDEQGSPVVFCIPGCAELNLKKAARAAGAKRIELIALRDLTPLTGYVRGGCSPLGMKKRYPTWLDETVVLYERVYVNAGARGMQVIVAPGDLIRATQAQTADLADF